MRRVPRRARFQPGDVVTRADRTDQEGTQSSKLLKRHRALFACTGRRRGASPCPWWLRCERPTLGESSIGAVVARAQARVLTADRHESFHSGGQVRGVLLTRLWRDAEVDAEESGDQLGDELLRRCSFCFSAACITKKRNISDGVASS